MTYGILKTVKGLANSTDRKGNTMFKLTKIDTRILNNTQALADTLRHYTTQLKLRGYCDIEIANALEWAQAPNYIGGESEIAIRGIAA